MSSHVARDFLRNVPLTIGESHSRDLGEPPSRAARSPVVLCALAVVLSLLAAGCSRGPESTGPPREVETIETASSPSANPTPEKSIACTFLTDKERRSIAGESISIVAPVPPAKGSDQCRWVKTLKSAAPTTVQVAVAPAQVWAKSVPLQVDNALRSGRAADQDLLKKLLDAKKKIKRGADKLTDKEACAMFSLLAQSNGRKKGVTETISFPPFGTQVAAQGRTCKDGIYATVTYSEIGLQPSSALSAAVLRLVKIAVLRASKANYAD